MLIGCATHLFYPSPHSFQKLELSDLRAGHREQLEDISAQLLLFEASLRGKEKQLQETLDRKDQVRFNLMQFGSSKKVQLPLNHIL